MAKDEKAKKEQEERLASIERKAVKLYKAIAVLKDLNDGKTKAISDCLTILENQLTLLEKTAAELVTAKFKQLKQNYAG